MTVDEIRIDQLIRSDRKTIALVVTRDGKLVVRAPRRVSMDLIRGFVQQKAVWIAEKQRQARQFSSQSIPHAFTAGETFLYLGRAYPLVVSPRARPALALEPPPGSTAQGAPAQAAFVLSAAAQPRARAAFEDWYRAQARLVVIERVAFYGARTGWQPAGLRISAARTRWGSCSARGVLSFTWRLVMAPLPVVDYVVVHELAHIAEKNHARAFWQSVQRILPEYAHQVAWLKANGHLLSLD